MKKISLIFPSIFFCFSLLFSSLHNVEQNIFQSIGDSFFNTFAFFFMIWFIKFNLELFYDSEEKYNNDIKNEDKTSSTEKILIKLQKDKNFINTVKETIMR